MSMAQQGAVPTDVLLMAGDDRFSEEVRHELSARGIHFAEIDAARMQGMVMPTLVVRGGCAEGDVSYEGLGRIRGEFLARIDSGSGQPATPAPGGHEGRPEAAR